jgi:SAM-dependent methyltransferase
MSDPLNREIHRSLVPITRLILASIFFLLSISVAFFQFAENGVPFVKPTPWLWSIVVGAAFLGGILLFVPTPGGGSSIANRQSLRPSEAEATAKEYGLSDAVSFYDRIAEVYDARLTRENLDTLRAAGRMLIDSFGKESRRLRVLDIGAGTGQFLRVLEGAQRIDWTCLEPSDGMAQVLRKFFEGPPISPQIMSIGWEDATRYLEGKQFDAIVFNFVVSSLPDFPDIPVISKLLAPNGVILISDAHPDIRAASASFRVRLKDGVHSLNIRHMSPQQIAHSLERTGQFKKALPEENITRKGTLYSFVLSYRKVP